MNTLIKTKVKYLFDDIFKGSTPKYEENSTEYIVLGQRNNSKRGIDFNECKYTNQYFFETRSQKEFLGYGDILINSLGGGTCGRVGFYNIKNQKILSDGIPFILRNQKSNKYLFYLLKTKQNILEDIAIGATNQVSLKDFDLLNLQVEIIPDQNKQKLIADYLDKKCSEIDEIMEDIQNQINTLEEYKKSVITEAVTKGLNPDVEMKDINIKWVSKIPMRWIVEKIKFHLKRKEVRNPGDKQILSVYREYGVIPKDSRDDNHNVTSEDTSKYKYVKPGYLVINKMKAWQGSLGISKYEGVVSPAYFIYKFTDKKLYQGYIHYLLRNNYKDEFRRISGGIREGQWDLDPFRFENTLILIPPIQEQKEIANYLDTKCAEIDEIIKNKKEQLETIEEYKKSLIYEYVTGKKEVINA